MPLRTRLSLARLESRDTPSVVNLTADEQYALELLNRARANPAAEAARYGIDLNEGLAPGTLSSSPVQPLAADQFLLAASRAHNHDMLTRGYFSHTTPEGRSPWDRAALAGYPGFASAENLATSFTSASDAPGAAVSELQQMLFVDTGVVGRGHRVNLLKANAREAGTGITLGPDANGSSAVYGSTLFGSTSGTPFLTGVVYTDGVTSDRFYTPGEGVANATVTAVSTTGQSFTTTTGAAGGYQVNVPAGAYTVTMTVPGGSPVEVGRVTVGTQNVKQDHIPSDTATAAVALSVEEVAVPADVVAVGAGVGTPPTVKFLDRNGQTVGSFLAYEADFTGGVRVATADVTGDGIEDVIVSPGPGRSPTVKVYDRTTGQVVREFDAFESRFTGGVYIAAADLTGDGKADVIATPDEGGGPRVDVYSGSDFGKLASYFGIDDPNFRGGARPALGDVNGDGVADLIVSAGFQGGPRVAGFDGRQLASGTPVKLFNDFFAFERNLRNGVFVAVGDLDGDGFGELIAGGGPGGGPRVTAYSGKELLANRQTVAADFFAGNTAERGGVRLAIGDVDGDGRADLITGSGSGAGSSVSVYRGSAVRGGALPAATLTMDVFPGTFGGVYVG